MLHEPASSFHLHLGLLSASPVNFSATLFSRSGGDCIFFLVSSVLSSLCSLCRLAFFPPGPGSFDCLLPSLHAALAPPRCHLQLISTNNDCDLAAVQSYKHAHDQARKAKTQGLLALFKKQATRVESCAFLSGVWVMIHGRAAAATNQLEEIQRARHSYSLGLTQTHVFSTKAAGQHNCVRACMSVRVSDVPGGTPVEMVEDVTTPWPAAVSAATCRV